MSTILVPTDLILDDQALQYALKINKKLQGEIILFHSVLASNFNELDRAKGRKIKTEAWRKESIQSLNKMKTELITKNPGMQISLATSNGWTSDQILAEEKKSKPDYIVMGKRNDNFLCEFLISSNCSVIIEKSTSPVILINSEAKISVPHTIVYATDYEEDDYKNIFSLVEFARNFESNVFIIHVIKDDLLEVNEQTKLEDLTEKIKSETGYSKIDFKLLISHNIYKGIKEYLLKTNPNMIALSIRDRHLKIFGKSLTKKFLFHPKIPLMVFHTRTSEI